MESYTFRCEREDCDQYRKTIDGVTMAHVMDAGTPICQECGDDLELVGADDGTEGDGDRVRKLAAILTSTANAIDALANEMPPPNTFTPRFMSLAINVRQASFDAQDARRNKPTAYGPVPGPPVNPPDAHPIS